MLPRLLFRRVGDPHPQRFGILDIAVHGVLDVETLPHYRGIVPTFGFPKLAVEADVVHELLNALGDGFVGGFPGAALG